MDSEINKNTKDGKYLHMSDEFRKPFRLCQTQKYYLGTKKHMQSDIKVIILSLCTQRV